ncbi:MAG: hypothetical protein WA705_04305 [Candidatus Ozemobacteraceae bacterium]
MKTVTDIHFNHEGREQDTILTESPEMLEVSRKDEGIDLDMGSETETRCMLPKKEGGTKDKKKDDDKEDEDIDEVEVDDDDEDNEDEDEDIDEVEVGEDESDKDGKNDDEDDDDDEDDEGDDDEDEEDDGGIETSIGVVLLKAAGVNGEAPDGEIRPLAKCLQDVFEAEGYEPDDTDQGSVDFIKALLEEIVDIEDEDQDALVVGSLQELSERLSKDGLKCMKNAVKKLMKRVGEYSDEEEAFVRQLKEIWGLTV